MKYLNICFIALRLWWEDLPTKLRGRGIDGIMHNVLLAELTKYFNFLTHLY